MRKNIVNLLLTIILAFCITGTVASQKIDSIAPVNTRVKEIIVICKTHFDIGYTHRVKDLLQYYRTEMIDKALDIMDKTNDLPVNQRFAWTAPGWVMEKVSEEWPGQSEERRQRLDNAFRSGRIVTHAVPFTLESESVFPEAIARGFAHSENVRNKYGLPMSRGAKMTDVPSQGNVLATVLANGGVKFLHIGCNWPSGYVNYPALFWWEGPDGSRILTLYSHVYSTSVGLLTPDAWTNHFPRDRSIGRDLIPPADWPYEVWPAIMVTPDNSGPPTAEKITRMFREAGELLPGVKIRTGTLEDFADALLATNPNIPVVRKEAPDTWIHGYGCDPGGMKTFRNLQPLIPALEVIDNQLRSLGIEGPDISGQVARSYELSLLYAEHTWGGAASVNKYGKEFAELPSSSYEDLEGSWEDKTGYIMKADSIVSEMLEAKLKALAAGINMRGKRYVVYNPLPWTRSEWVKLPESDSYVFAKDVPPCGYISISQKNVPGKVTGNSVVSENSIENEFYRIIFDAED